MIIDLTQEELSLLQGCLDYTTGVFMGRGETETANKFSAMADKFYRARSDDGKNN